MAYLAPILALLLLAVLYSGVSVALGSRLYITHQNGFVAFGGDTRFEAVSAERFERIMRRFMIGDLFDRLSVSRLNDIYGGVYLCQEVDSVELRCSFRSLEEPDRLSNFRQGMSRVTCLSSDEHSWNVGRGEDLESTTLTYRLRTDFTLVWDSTQLALNLVDGPPGPTYYVSLSSRQDGPPKFGIKLVRRRNLLAKIP